MRRGEFVSAGGDAGTNGGTGATGGSSAGNSAGGSGGTAGVAGNAGSSSGGSTTGGGGGSAGSSGSGGGFHCAEMDCDDDNECTTDSCNATDGCVHEARQGQPCNDGVFCNGEDRCVGTRCEEHLGDPCNGATTVCDEGQDTCVGCISNSDCPDEILGAYSNCMFDVECAVSGTKFRTVTTFTCTAGTCKPSTTTQPADCSRTTNGQPCAADGNPCTSDVCNGGACTHATLADGSLCSNETGVASSNALCCGGHCRSTHSDKDNCGGCFVKCGGTPSECQDGYCTSRAFEQRPATALAFAELDRMLASAPIGAGALASSDPKPPHGAPLPHPTQLSSQNLLPATQALPSAPIFPAQSAPPRRSRHPWLLLLGIALGLSFVVAVAFAIHDRRKARAAAVPNRGTSLSTPGGAPLGDGPQRIAGAGGKRKLEIMCSPACSLIVNGSTHPAETERTILLPGKGSLRVIFDLVKANPRLIINTGLDKKPDELMPDADATLTCFDSCWLTSGDGIGGRGAAYVATRDRTLKLRVEPQKKHKGYPLVTYSVAPQ